MITASATLQGVISATAQFVAVQSGGCADATVENSDASYSSTVASGGTLVLPDETFEIYIGGVLNQTFTHITLKNETINIYP